jgi:hypothetical protein
MRSRYPELSSSEDFQREAAITRGRLAQGLDELSGRLTPGQVFDEMLTYTKVGGGPFLRALTNASRENPIPSLLIGAGCMLFLSEKMGLTRHFASKDESSARAFSAGQRSVQTASAAASAASRASDAVSSGVQAAANGLRSGVTRTTGLVGEQASSAADRVKGSIAAAQETVEAAGHDVQAMTSELGDRISCAAGQMSASISDTASQMRSGVSGAAAQLRTGAQNVAGTVQDYSAAIGEQVAGTIERGRQAARSAGKAKDTTLSFIGEQPMLCAALALSVGAALAAVLPRTETEDQVMGEASDAVKSAAQGVASEQFHSAKEAGGKVVQEALDAAKREGLTAAAASQTMQSVGDSIKRVVTEAATTADKEMQNLAQRNES